MRRGTTSYKLTTPTRALQPTEVPTPWRWAPLIRLHIKSSRLVSRIKSPVCLFTFLSFFYFFIDFVHENTKFLANFKNDACHWC